MPTPSMVPMAYPKTPHTVAAMVQPLKKGTKQTRECEIKIKEGFGKLELRRDVFLLPSLIQSHRAP
jgi:hypothetical protein